MILFSISFLDFLSQKKKQDDRVSCVCRTLNDKVKSRTKCSTGPLNHRIFRKLTAMQYRINTIQSNCTFLVLFVGLYCTEMYIEINREKCVSTSSFLNDLDTVRPPNSTEKNLLHFPYMYERKYIVYVCGHRFSNRHT